MKKLIIILIFVSFNCHAEVITISKRDLVGTWATRSLVDTWESFFNLGIKVTKKTIVNKLFIKKDYSIIFERYSPDGEVEKYIAKKRDLKYAGDICIMQFHYKKQLAYKLVLSGWKDKKFKLLFGTLYIYSHDQIFNGLPVTFKKITDNNTVDSDAQKSVR